MPFWDRDRWRPIQEYYGGGAKAGLKRCIEALVETPYEELDRWDHASLREWMAQYTVRRRRLPRVGGDLRARADHLQAARALRLREPLHAQAALREATDGGLLGLADGRLGGALEAHGGRPSPASSIAPATVDRVVVRDGAVRGVQLRDGSTLEADEVVVSAPVWDVPKLFDDGALPWDFLARVKLLANNRNRACWLGYWIAAEEPVIAGSEREMSSFFATPRTGLPGFTLNFTGYDPGVSPPGEYLTCFGAAFDATEHYGDRGWYDRMFHDLWLDIEEMLPAARGALWKKPHLVTTYGVICKPGLVGAVRPDALVRGVEGLYLTGDTTRARGIGVDKAARSGITSAEAVLGRRLEHFADTVRY